MDRAGSKVVRCAVPVRWVSPRPFSTCSPIRSSTPSTSSSSSSPSPSSSSTTSPAPSVSSEGWTTDRADRAPFLPKRRAPGHFDFNPPSERIQRQVSGLLEPLGLKLEPAVIERALTHKSYSMGHRGVPHSEKYSFIGRRVLRMHLSIYLTNALKASPELLARFVTAETIGLVIETRELGSQAGKAIQLENVLRWRQIPDPSGKPSGLYNARGTAVEALVGAVHVSQGIEASKKAFESLVLPNIVWPADLMAALKGEPVPDASVATEQEPRQDQISNEHQSSYEQQEQQRATA